MRCDVYIEMTLTCTTEFELEMHIIFANRNAHRHENMRPSLWFIRNFYALTFSIAEQKPIAGADNWQIPLDGGQMFESSHQPTFVQVQPNEAGGDHQNQQLHKHVDYRTGLDYIFYHADGMVSIGIGMVFACSPNWPTTQ